MVKIRHPKGDQKNYTFTVYDSSTVANLSGVTPTLTVVENTINERVIYEKTGTVTNAAGGVITFEVLSTDFKAKGSYQYKVLLTFSGGQRETIKWGVFDVY